MKLTLALIISCLVFSNLSRASIVVVYFTKDKIAIAADSRQMAGDSPLRDDYCKVAALGGQLVFASTGMAGYTGHPRVPAWNIMTEARKAFEKVSSANANMAGHAKDVAVALADTVADKLVAEATWDRPNFMKTLGDGEGLINVSILGGRRTDGTMELLVLKLKYDARSNSVGGGVDFPDGCPDHHFCASGSIDIYNEFAEMTSERARTENIFGPISDSTVAPMDYDLRRAVRFVELTIQHREPKDVGGPIDAVELGTHGTARWYKRKSNCPEN